MRKQKMCIRCELQRVRGSAEYCDECWRDLNPQLHNSGIILTNDDLFVIYVPNNYQSFERYLEARQYRRNTINSYLAAVREIEERVHMSFEEITKDIDGFIARCRDADKRKISFLDNESRFCISGNKNAFPALGRLKEFVSYRQSYKKKP